MTRRLTPREKLQRKPASRACTFCHSKHLQCSNTRPCQNCTKRKIEHECQDVVRKRASYLHPVGEKRRRKSTSKTATESKHIAPILAGARKVSAASEGENTATASDTSGENERFSAPPTVAKSLQPAKPMHPFTPQMDYVVPMNPGLDELSTMSSMNLINAMDPGMESAHTSLDTFQQQNRDSPSSTPSTTANFNSMFLNQEYMMLGDLISKPSSPSSGFAAIPDSLMTPEFFSGLEDHDSRPYISLGEAGQNTRENGFNFDLSATDELEYVSPLLSHHIYQTVQDIYSNRIINFDYPSSYHSLTYFLKSRFSVTGKFLSAEEKTRKRSTLLVILKLIASYRPTFISAHKSLFQPFDFQFLEMSFQRCLLDFENLSRLNASPMIIWRRTGEIVSMSAHLADILGLDISDVLSKRTFIMELMYDDGSIVEYFRLFKSVAIGSLHSTIFTKCKLIKKPTENKRSTKTNARLTDDFIEFCSVWTVKRDLFDLPMMIVGHFLPSLPNNDTIRSY